MHRCAWAVADADAQALRRSRLLHAGSAVSEVRDRIHFRSICFHEPGGVLFETATRGPGFCVDEPPGELGRSPRLPPWLERKRERIEAVLPPLEASRPHPA
ncbi:MAG: hypothetical protein WB626_13000 [Bacteroidota bacterium]